MSSDTTQTIDGTGTIAFVGTTGGTRNLSVEGSTTLTLGADLTVRGGRGHIGKQISTGGANGVINQGTILADVAGQTLTIDPTGNGGTFSNQGTVTAVDGTLIANKLTGNLGRTQTINGTLVLNGNAIVDSQDSITSFITGTISISGDLTGDTTLSPYFDPAGITRFSGSGSVTAPQLLEVMGADLGDVPAGYSDNFNFGSLAVGIDTYVKLVDDSDNSPGSATEAIYVNSLIVGSGSTLDLNGLNLYARAAQVDGNIVGGTVVQTPDSGALEYGVPTPGSISVAGELDEWQFFGARTTPLPCS